jgi:hypothetical protein
MIKKKMFSFCCRRPSIKIINENFKQISADISYFKNELQELRQKQQQTKKNLVKIIDTFTLNEYVLFKTRLLTRKQTEDLIDELYEFYEIPLRFRYPQGFQKLEDEIAKLNESSLFDEQLAQYHLILRQVQELRQILDKLEEPGLKDGDYALKKAEWSSTTNPKCSITFLDNTIKCIKRVV